MRVATSVKPANRTNGTPKQSGAPGHDAARTTKMRCVPEQNARAILPTGIGHTVY